MSRSAAARKAWETRRKRMAMGFYKDSKGRTRPITPRKPRPKAFARTREEVIQKLEELEELNRRLEAKNVPYSEREFLIAEISVLKWLIGEYDDF